MSDLIWLVKGVKRVLIPPPGTFGLLTASFVVLFLCCHPLIFLLRFIDNDFRSESNSYQKGPRGASKTIFIRGFDSSLGEDEVYTAQGILALLSN